MLERTDVRCETRVTSIQSKDDYVVLEDEKGFTWEAEAVILTCPIPQLHSLIPDDFPQTWKDHSYTSNWTLICTGTGPVPQQFLDYESSSIELIRRGINHSRSNVLIVHMSNQWSKENLENSRDEVTEKILQELQPLNSEWLENSNLHSHRWRFARPLAQPERYEHDRISFAGDAWSSPIGTIEASLKSAEFAALELIWKLHYAKKPEPISLQTTLF